MIGHVGRLAAARVRRVRSDDTSADDSGFVLVYVMMIIGMVTLMVSSSLVVTGESVIPAVQTSYNQAAYAAAQGGIAAFVSYADRNCTDANSSVSGCTLPTNFSDTVSIQSSAGYSSSYVWSAQKDPTGRYFRVRATGTVRQGGLSAAKTLVADVAGGASNNLLDYGVVTGFETQSPDIILANSPARTIALDSAAIENSGVPVKGGQIRWSGASPGVAAGKVATCNTPFGGSRGRINNLPPKAPNPYVDWSESGLAGNNYTHFAPCQVSFGSGTKLLTPANPADGPGGYYSKDALLLSNGYPGGSGPLFNQPVTTGYQYTTADGPCGKLGQNYRPFNLVCAGYPVEVGGAPSPSSKYDVQYVATGPNLPTNSPDIPANACVYAGPTRVKLNSDGTAVVTSPQTTATWVTTNAATRPAQCYAGADASGMAFDSVSLVSPTIIPAIYAKTNGNGPPTTPAIAHGSSGWNTTGQKLGDTASTGNSVFYASSGALPTVDPSSTTAADAACATATYSSAPGATCAWTNLRTATDGNGSGTAGWTSYTAGTGCSAALASTDRLAFECDFNGGSVGTSHDFYSIFRSRIAVDLARGTCRSGTVASQQSCLQAFLTTELAPANTSTHRYVVTAATPATTSTTQTLSSNAAPSAGNDPFFDSTTNPGTPTTETQSTSAFTFTVSRQVFQGNQWGSDTTAGASTPQFSMSMTNIISTLTSAGSIGVSSFPTMADVTQYQIGTNGTFGNNGPGDLYVGGTSARSLAIIAQNDVIITDDLAPTDTVNQALEVIAFNDMRVFHPVKCRSTVAADIAATDPRFCPNDITGLYTKVLPDGARPSQQYTDLRPDLAGLTIRAALFALGVPQTSINCPQPPQGGGVCGGEFFVDNYDRGDSVGTSSLGTLLIVGTLGMAHHGPAGQEWEIADTAGQTSRPHSGYLLSVQYQNLKNAIMALNTQGGVTGLQTTSSTSSLWHVVSVSTGATS